MRFIGRFLMLVALVAAWPSLGQAQSPPDPKQIVTLMTDLAGPTAPCDGVTRLLINAVIDPADGSLSPFVIPQNRVLVLTGGTWSFGPGLTPGSANILEIFLTTPTSATAIVLGPSIPASTAGWAAAVFTLEPGIVLRPGASLCVGLRTDNTQLTIATPRLFGFIARDR